MTAGLLFVLRFARTERRSDLVLAGLGIGLAAGTKWYAVPGALVLIGVLAGCRHLAGAGWRARWPTRCSRRGRGRDRRHLAGAQPRRVPRGTDIAGLGISAALAAAVRHWQSGRRAAVA